MTTCGEDLLKKVELLYRQHPQGVTFEEEIASHLRNGVIYSDGTALLLAKPTVRNIHVNHEPVWPKWNLEVDAWWISLFVGDMTRLPEIFFNFAFKLPYVGWCRRGGEPRFYEWNALWKKLTPNSYENLDSRELALSPRNAPRDTRSADEVPLRPQLQQLRRLLKLRLRRSLQRTAKLFRNESAEDSPAPN